MTTWCRHLRGAWGTLVAVVAGVVAAVGLCACGAQPPPTKRPAATASFPTSAVPTSMEASDGSWAAVPMGNLSEPLNTFWQLFFLPSDSSTWSNDIEATAVATNGGLALGSAGNRVVVGVVPSNMLTYSPLIVTDDAGGSWSNGLLTDGLAPRPDSLALASDAEALALVGSGSGDRVLSSAGGLSSWQLLATRTSLVAATGRTCDPSALTAVAFLGGSPVVGADCDAPGEAGIFLWGTKGFGLSGPVLGASVANARVSVLGVQSTAAGLDVLLGVAQGPRDELLACSTADGTTWAVSSPLRLDSPDQVASFGPDDADGLFVVLRGSSGAQRALLLDPPSTTWQQLPSLPARTATLAFAGGTTDALTVASTVLTVWSMGPGATTWTQGQEMHVPIEFGSSS